MKLEYSFGQVGTAGKGAVQVTTEEGACCWLVTSLAGGVENGGIYEWLGATSLAGG